MTPFLSVNGKIDEPYLVLSKQIVVTNYSNYINIHEYIINNIETAVNGFHVHNLDIFDIYFVLRYNKLRFDFLKHNKFYS